MRYMIIGAGGMGGLLGAYLAAAGREVALLARGEHLCALQQNGLTLHSVAKGDICLKNIEAYAAEDDFIPGEVVLVCVKGYSLAESLPTIAKAARPGAVVIPVLNSLQAGIKLQQALPHLTVLDGCIYASAFIAAPGIICHPARVLRLVFGARAGQAADADLLQHIAADLHACDMRVELSSCIERDIYKKFCFISAFAATGCYFNVNAGTIQRLGREHDMFDDLVRELVQLVQAQQLAIDSDLYADTLHLLEKTAPDITASMHKDMLAGKPTEKQELIFSVVELAGSLGVAVPAYQRIARHFGYEA